MKTHLQNVTLLLALLCCYAKSFSQPTEMLKKHHRYNNCIFRTEAAMRAENYATGKLYSDSAQAIFPFFHKPYFELEICNAGLGDYQAAYDHAVKMASMGMYSEIPADVLGDFATTGLYKKFLREEDSLVNSAIKKYDTAFCNPLKRLLDAHQADFNKLASQRDTTIFHQLVTLCEKYGFPTYFNAGIGLYRKFASSLPNFFKGYPYSEDWQKIIALYEKELASGRVESGYFGGMEDLYLYEQGKTVKYGVWVHWMDYYKDMKFPSLEELNKNRKEVGLGDFELWVSCLGYDLNAVLKDMESRK